jgi:hypothetical protein
MDSSVDKALLVHMPTKIVQFKQMKNSLYTLNPTDAGSYIHLDSKIQMVNTV